MADDLAKPREPMARALAAAGARLRGRRAILIAAAAAFLLLVLAGALGWLPALAAFFAIAGVAVLIPREAEADNVPVAGAARGERAEAVLRHFADTLPDACLLLDGRGVVIHRNPAAARQFPTTLTGAALAASMRQPALLAALDAVLRSGESQTIELHQTVPSEAWYEVTVARLSGLDRNVVVVLRNLTEQKRIDGLRADFIANASHELRTPLTSLIGYVDTLLGPAANDAAARKRFLGIMRSQGARMSNLIDDLLSLSRIEMRQHLRPTGRVDLAHLIREVREGLAPMAGEAGVAIEVALPDGPAEVTGDRDELYEVFENLIDNAIKYGGDGGRVSVALAAADDRPGGPAWLATVTDYGSGIAAEHVPRLTERFYRVDAESSRKKKGTGLGLAIVKHILNRHHAQMTIRSRPGEGTRVEVLLPR